MKKDIMEILHYKPIRCRYCFGEEYLIPFNPDIWNNDVPYFKDKWTKQWLIEKGFKVRNTAYIVPKYKYNTCIGLAVVNVDYPSTIP